MKPSRSCLLPASLALAALAATPAAFAQSAGVFTFANVGTGNNDANVGLNTSKTYLQAYNFGEAVNVTVNGVTFTGVAGTNPTVGGVFSTTNLTTVNGGGGTVPGGVLGSLTNKFVYGPGAPGTAAQTFTLSNLTAGKTYVVTHYYRSWEAAAVGDTNGRRQNLAASGASNGSLVFWDMDNGAAAQGSLNLLRYTFQATTTSQVLSFTPRSATFTTHQFGFSVEDVFTGSFPTTYTSGADWSTATWSNGVPNAAAANAILNSTGAPATLNLDSNITLGNLKVDGTNGWTLSTSSAKTLTLQTDVGGSAIVSNTAGTLAVSTDVVLNSTLAKFGAGAATLSGSVTGAGGLAVGGGTLSLNGPASYAGTTIVGDTLNVAANANTTSGSYVINTGAIVNFGSFSDYGVASSMGNRLDTSDTGVDTDAATAGIGLHIRGGTIQYTGSTPQSTNRQIRVSTAGAIFDASGSVPTATLSFTRSTANTNFFESGGNRTITLTGSNTGNNNFSLIITETGGTTSLTKSGLGTWNYSGLGTYTGNTTVNQGKLILSGNRIATASNITVGTTSGMTATLDQTAGNFTVNGGTQVLVGNSNGTGIYNFSGGTLTGTASATRGIILGVNNGTTGTFNLSGGTLAMGSSNLQVSRSENAAATAAIGNYNQTGGTATFGTIGIGGAFTTNNASNIGNFNVTGGTFSAAGWTNNVIAGGTGSTANLTIGGTAQVTLPAFPAKVGAVNLTFDGGTLLPLATSGSYLGGLDTATITANGAKFDVGAGKDITASQVFTGPGGLTKLGSGTMALSSAQSYTGTTTVNSGSLFVNGLAGNVAVTSLAAFGGTGSVGAITTAVGSVLIPGGPTTAGTLSPSALSLNGNSVINAEFGVSSDLINVTTAGGLNIGGGIFNLYAAGGLNPLTTNGTYTLLDYDTSFTGSIANLSIGNAQAGKFYSIADNSGATTIELTVADATTSAWNGAGDGVTWSDNANWANNLSPNALGAVALFSGTGTVVNVDGPKTVSNINFDNATSYTVSGSTITLNNGVASAVVSAASGSHSINAPLILGTALNLTPATGTTLNLGAGVNGLKNIAMSGPGSVNLGGSSTFAGLAVTGGSLNLSGAAFGVLGVTGGSATLSGSNTFASMTVTGGSVTLAGNNSYGATDLVSGSVTVGTGGNLGSGNVTIAGNNPLNFNHSNDITVASNLLGSGAVVTKSGAGVLTLSGTNTIASSAGGSLNLNAGTVRIGSASALPATVNLVLNGGTLDLNTNSIVPGTLTSSTGTITDLAAGAGTSTVTLGSASNLSFSAVMADGGSRKVGLIKVGTGTLTLTGANTSTGGTTIADGTVTLLNSGGNALSGPVTIGDTLGSDILLLGASNQLSDSSVVTLTAGGSGNSAFLRLGGFSETIRGIQTSVGNAAVIENSHATNASTLTVDTAGADYTYDGIIRNGAAGTLAVIKTGVGTLTIANTANVTGISHSGGTTLSAGSLVFSDVAACSSPIINSLTTADLVITQATRTGTFSGVISGPGFTKNGSAALSLANAANTFANGGIVFNEGTILLSAGGPNIAGAGQFTCMGAADPANVLTVGNGRILGINATGPFGQSTSIQSAFAPSVVIEAGGKLTGNGFVAFVPNLTLNGGTVEIGNGNTTGGFNTNLGFLGTVVVGGSTPSSIVTTGTGANAVASLGVIAANAGTTFQVADATGSPAADLTISSILRDAQANASALTKTGAGTLLLSGANTYTGGTSLLAGTIVLDNNAALGTGGVTVTGGTLDLNGQFVTNAATVDATLTGNGGLGATTLNGISNPGGSGFGVHTFASLTLGSAAQINLQLGGTVRGTSYDAVSAFAPVALDGTITVTLNGLTAAAGQSFDLLDATDVFDVTNFDINTDLVLPGLPAGLAWDRSAFVDTGVVSIVNAFDAWAASNGLEGANALPDADPDGDGISNALEYAFGISPSVGNGPEYRGVASTTSGALTLAYRRPLGGVAGVTYGVEFKTADLVVGNTGWTAGVLNTDYTRVITPNGDGTTETVTISLTGAVSGKKFARVSVTY